MQIDRKVNGLHIKYSQKEMEAEIKNILSKKGDFSAGCTYNKTTGTYNGHFYEQEKRLYDKLHHRRLIIENLIKYLVRDWEYAGEEVGKNKKRNFDT